MNFYFPFTKKPRAALATPSPFRTRRVLNGLWRHRVLAALVIVVAVFGVEFYALKLPKANAAYTIANSARFISGNSDYLSKTFGSAPADRKKGTISVWIKRGDFNRRQTFAAGYDGSSGNSSWLEFGSAGSAADNLSFSFGGSSVYEVRTSALFRDPAAWTHVVAAWDTTSGTASERVKLYINGVQATALDAANYPAQNDQYQFALNNANNRIGAQQGGSSVLFDGYMSDYYFVDGAALAPTCFGETDANGYWRPKTYSTASPCAAYGTNGFKLSFGTGSALGTDTSGNANNWATSTNMTAAVSQMTDSPTNSFATLSPINVTTGITLSSGNLGWASDSANSSFTASTIGVSSGKWYWEIKQTSSNRMGTGVINATIDNAAYRGNTDFGTNAYEWGILTNGNKIYNSSIAAYGSSVSSGDTIMVALNADTGKIWFGNNGTWFDSGDPAAGTGEAYSGLTGTLAPAVARQTSTDSATFNFGQGGQSGLTYDSASGGTFKYTPPSGFKALSTANLPVPTIAQPNLYFNAQLYGGTGSAMSVNTTNSQTVTVFLTSGTSYTIPSDWNSNSNTIEVIGGGGGGGAPTTAGGAFEGGGGGGAYSKISNLSLTAGNSVTISVGAGGTAGNAGSNGGNGGDTYFNGASCAGASVCAKAGLGSSGNSGGTGGQQSGNTGGVGTVLNMGGNGGAGSTAGAGGGGAGGNRGNGGTGGAAGTGNTGGGGGGGGGGCGLSGTNGSAGSAGANGTDAAAAGGAGGANAGGVAGGIGGSGNGVAGGAGSAGSGGGGGASGGNAVSPGSGSVGSAGTDWDASHGCGGGGGGNGANPFGGAGSVGNHGGLYGGGGGAAGFAASGMGSAGAGAKGVIVITYTPSASVFQPDLVWIKDRTSVMNHALFDAVRGVQNWLSSNLNSAEVASSTTLTAFNTNGFTLGTATDVNKSGDNFISWMWKESPTSGFDIVTYTGTGVAKTEVHALSSAPEMIIVKDRTAASTNDWAVYHASNTAAPETDYLLLNSTAATADDATYWNDTAPTASVFSVGTNADVNTNTNTYVAYLFDQVDGFSKFGSYTGNGSTDGPFVYTGFKPRYILIKSSDQIKDWIVRDTARNPYNPTATNLFPYTSDADSTGTDYIDILSNGFKIRTTGSVYNTSSGVYTYAAFADVPFYYSAQAAATAASSFVQAIAFLMGMTF